MSKISSDTYNRPFNSWIIAIKDFIKYVNIKNIPVVQKNTNTTESNKQGRDPSLRLRYKVLKRDNFSCVQCGNSPAKDQKVVLHVDHIKP